LSKDLKCADYTKYDINRLFSTTKAKKNKQIWGGLVSWENVININFLQKERLYTKLKYSRSPAYDIVSGGAAALFAGLLGFLTSEKFGFELVDSGDFYYLFMYVVFLSFSVRPLLLVSEFDKSFWNTFSFYKIYNFYFTVYLLVVQNIFTWCTINFSYTPTKVTYNFVLQLVTYFVFLLGGCMKFITLLFHGLLLDFYRQDDIKLKN
jgi:hypothetical protein